jgi:NitT/TauT family transport system permease protein
MRFYIKLISPIIFVVVWEILAILINNAFILPRVGPILEVLIHPFVDIQGSGSLVENALISLERVTTGFLLGALVAIPVGVMMGRFSMLDQLVDPLIQLLRPIPPIAWIPLALAWFKIGFASIVFIIFIGALFPILLNTIDGVKRVNRTWIEASTMFGATELQTLGKVILPASMPTIWTGLRVGFGIAWMSVVAAEMLPGTSSGLGYLIIYSYNFGQLQVTVAGMVVIGLIGLFVDTLLRSVEKRQFAWQGLER